jgi:hypothetical protein
MRILPREQNPSGGREKVLDPRQPVAGDQGELRSALRRYCRRLPRWPVRVADDAAN